MALVDGEGAPDEFVLADGVCEAERAAEEAAAAALLAAVEAAEDAEPAREVDPVPAAGAWVVECVVPLVVVAAPAGGCVVTGAAGRVVVGWVVVGGAAGAGGVQLGAVDPSPSTHPSTLPGAG